MTHAMARKLRLEYPGAFYHVINRGNYRAWIFLEQKTRTAFQTCLFEACERSQWLLHAFVIMGNHFHLALETPLGNLVAGMHWLQTTFATRFNRKRQEQGTFVPRGATRVSLWRRAARWACCAITFTSIPCAPQL
jgi:putative transposase